MDITNKMLADLAYELGIDAGGGTASNNRERAGATSGGGSQMNMNDINKIADRYKGKSDSELLAEISKIKGKLKKDRKLYEQQLKAVQALRPMMNAEQRARLDKIIEILGE